MAEFLGVVFDLPLRRVFTYRNDPGRPASTGCRVEAPFGTRMREGFVVGEMASNEDLRTDIRTIARSVDATPLFGQGLLDLARWISGMYLCSLGEALGAMLPSARREPRREPEAPAMAAGGQIVRARAFAPTEEQAAAIRDILERPSGTTYVYGLTGSGKTEVFLQAAEATLAEGRGVIYLVPEIALTGQVIDAAVERFGPGCAVLHSRLTPARKLAEWRRILDGSARVVIGARSAVFAPVERLGLIVIDEEHEPSYKSGAAPRYHARQVAMKRASVESARLVLGSATPSVESWHLMRSGSMRRASLKSRPAGGAVPVVRIVDMRREQGTISAPLAAAVRASLEEGRQSILFLNRRGFSWFFRCNTCGGELRCRHCSVGLTYHKERDSLECHYCGYRERPPRVCPACGSLDVAWNGFGTERIGEDAGRLFPGARIARLDADTTVRRGALESILEDFRNRRADILLGTQMVAKGLDFPGVKTIGVVLADTSLNLPDFRAAERTFSLVVQVAGRAGRHLPDGEVYVQTFRPGSPVIRLAAALDADSFYEQELEQRNALGFPPYTRLVRVVFRSGRPESADRAADLFARSAAAELPPGAEMLGPAECPLGLVAGSARRQILFRSTDLRSLHAAVARVASEFACPRDVHAELDVDPIQLL